MTFTVDGPYFAGEFNGTYDDGASNYGHGASSYASSIFIPSWGLDDYPVVVGSAGVTIDVDTDGFPTGDLTVQGSWIAISFVVRSDVPGNPCEVGDPRPGRGQLVPTGSGGGAVVIGPCGTNDTGDLPIHVDPETVSFDFRYCPYPSTPGGTYHDFVDPFVVGVAWRKSPPWWNLAGGNNPALPCWPFSTHWGPTIIGDELYFCNETYDGGMSTDGTDIGAQTYAGPAFTEAGAPGNTNAELFAVQTDVHRALGTTVFTAPAPEGDSSVTLTMNGGVGGPHSGDPGDDGIGYANYSYWVFSYLSQAEPPPPPSNQSGWGILTNV